MLTARRLSDVVDVCCSVYSVINVKMLWEHLICKSSKECVSEIPVDSTDRLVLARS